KSLTALCEHQSLGTCFPDLTVAGHAKGSQAPAPTPIGCQFLKSGCGSFPSRKSCRGVLRAVRLEEDAAKKRDYRIFPVALQPPSSTISWVSIAESSSQPENGPELPVSKGVRA
ncbi:MAG: hypothetical protein ABI607_08780, partial [Betaproteobacteria bacterium]